MWVILFQKAVCTAGDISLRHGTGTWNNTTLREGSQRREDTGTIQSTVGKDIILGHFSYVNIKNTLCDLFAFNTFHTI